MFISRLLIILVLLTSKINAFPQNKVNVHMEGISPDSSVKRLSVARTQRFFSGSGIDFLMTSNIIGHSFDLNFNPDGERFVRIFQTNKTWHFYVKPGDSVRFVLSKKDEPNSIIFYGKNAGRYNAIAETQYEQTQLFKKDNLTFYKALVEKWRDRSDSIVRAYYENKKIDGIERDLILDDVINRYVSLTYQPLMSFDYAKVAPKDYLENVSKIKLKNRKGNLSERYLTALNLKYIKTYDLDSSRGFETKFNIIKRELKGISREFAVASLIHHYAEKQNGKDRQMMFKALNYAKNILSDSLYISVTKLAEFRYFLQNKPLPDRLLDTTFLTKYHTGEKISLRAVFEEHKNKGIYVDFWASWCEPCIDEIENSRPGIDLLTDNNYVNIYISIDQNEAKWAAASKLHNITKNQYLMPNDPYHPLLKFLALLSLPRYLLFNDQHRIISIYAPRPSGGNINDLKRVIDSVAIGL